MKNQFLVKIIRSMIEKMSDEERMEMIYFFMEGYCMSCGKKEINGTCYCMNDE